VETIVGVMRQLGEEKLGIFHERYSCPPLRTMKRIFIKRPTYEIHEGLENYGIRLSDYEDRFQQFSGGAT
jgi:hypothetical protein